MIYPSRIVFEPRSRTQCKDVSNGVYIERIGTWDFDHFETDSLIFLAMDKP